ncbi:hypothetical protein GlitD10_0493 [Gloeomargarita lithophora Alchichica-D10]|uniref:Uncharacterized protein n=2 Tax=Gloeomargarita TaxID=1188227 RepID=A0A1J0AA71_9CYAN|nr:hypothetical protein [Gloeomargarita lithophora]APB32805.1 hypothetical protein GlitD10_0493 [Gloeomargarita lithophora Alchichica-D10]
MTTAQGHRSKIERVIADKGGLVICAPVGAPRVRLGYFPPANKFFLYLGFETQGQAMDLYLHLVEQGKATKYNHATDSGLRLPRRSEYVTGYEWEIKWHRPPVAMVDYFIRKDKKRQAELAAATVGEPETFGCKEYPQDHSYYA